jgi:hypothetical protein
LEQLTAIVSSAGSEWASLELFDIAGSLADMPEEWGDWVAAGLRLREQGLIGDDGLCHLINYVFSLAVFQDPRCEALDAELTRIERAHGVPETTFDSIDADPPADWRAVSEQRDGLERQVLAEILRELDAAPIVGWLESDPAAWYARCERGRAELRRESTPRREQRAYRLNLAGIPVFPRGRERARRSA